MDAGRRMQDVGLATLPEEISDFGFRISAHPPDGQRCLSDAGEAGAAIRGSVAEPRIAGEPFTAASVVMCETGR